jgi:hypothetical protein
MPDRGGLRFDAWHRTMSGRQVLCILAGVLESRPLMAIETRTIKVKADTTIDDVLNAADDAPVTIERHGVTYTVRRGHATDDENIWKDYDPQAVIDMLEDFKNNPMDIDAAQWIADVYRSREEGSRSDDRP